MYPFRFAFEGYALIGMTLLIMALAALFLILRQPAQSAANRVMAAFFACIALSGVATVLNNAMVFWGSLLAPWQDFWVLAGGVALVRYAYVHPRCDQPREAMVALCAYAPLAVFALAFCVVFAYRFAFRWSPDLAVPLSYYLLLPLGTLCIVVLFLRRSVHCSRQVATGDQAAGLRAPPGVLQLLIRPQGADARLLRDLALALCVAFLPGVGMLVELPVTLTFAVQHLGSLFAVAAVAVVYLGRAPGTSSFVTKLVGVVLLIVTLLIGGMGNFFFRELERIYDTDRLSLVARARAALASGESLSFPPPLSYIVAWDASRPADADAYRVLFTQPQQPDFDLTRLVAENRAGHLAAWSRRSKPVLAALGEEFGYAVPRWRSYPAGSGVPDYTAFGFDLGDSSYEFGLLEAHRERYLHGVVTAWLASLGVGTALVLLVIPVFLRATLVRPLEDLIAGMRRVEAGALDTSVPVRYADEVGQLTRFFNSLTRTLKGSYEELEHRVAARTRELGAFFDLAMLGDARQGLDETLAHALRRIADAGGCSAVCLHLAAEDAQDLDLVAHAGIAAQALAELRSAPLDGEWVARRCEAEQPWVPREPFPETALPPPLRVPGSRHYLGTSLGCGTGVRGWLSCYCRDGTGFGVSEASLLAALARQIGVIVENHRLQQITGQLAALEERQRLARDLHDSVTQLMYGLGLFSRAARDAIADGDAVRATSNLEKVGDTAELALREMRSLLFELQPPAVEEVGLAHALEQRLDLVERRLGIRVRDHIDDSIALPSAVARELYMVAMECLNNALKHARADELRVSLVRSNGAVEMSIADNGCGFDPALVSRGLGLSNVARRVARLGGELRLEAAVGSGARITVTVPVATAVAAKCLSGRAL